MNGKIGRFELIVGVHDLAEPADARGDEIASWLCFSEALPLLDRVFENARISGVALHVTSDDAFRSDYEHLLPWLLDKKVKGSFFIPSRFLDLPGRLTTERLREMVALGMSIGVHGAQHIDWTKVSRREFLADVREGRDQLQQVLGVAIDTVAPPFGGYNGYILKSLLDEGYREVYSCRSGLALRSEALKPRNMLKRSQLATVLETSMRTGGLRDDLRCRLRRLRAGFDYRMAAS